MLRGIDKTVYGCEYLLTWNCRHIANAELYRAIRRVVERRDYEVPSLCTPEELIGEDPAPRADLKPLKPYKQRV